MVFLGREAEAGDCKSVRVACSCEDSKGGEIMRPFWLLLWFLQIREKAC